MNRLLIAIQFLVLSFAVNAQELTGALPMSMRMGLDPHDVPTLTASTFDAAAAATADAEREAAGKMPLYARFVPAEATLATAGSWTELPGGDRLWRLRVSSPGAQAMELLFSDAFIPSGAQVHVYDEARTEVIGGFSSVHVQPEGSFTTDMVHGDACIVEYHEPAAVRGEGSLHLVQVAHAYRMVAQLKSDACEVDINCSEGAAWADQRDAVVRIRVAVPSGFGYCTGTLVNNTANDCKGYILTAFHCTEDSQTANFPNYQFRFRYQYPGCASGSATGANMTGCSFRAGSQDQGGMYGSDYSLLETTAAIPAGYEPYWAGWDVSEDAPTGAVCIHHPDGDVKKISTVSGTPTSSTWSGFTNGSHWRLTWATTANGHGVTEPGSSGSPLFNSAKRVVGTLTGGSSCCTVNGCGNGTAPNYPDYYGKMDYHWWENNPNPTIEELHWWLSPVGFPVYQNGSRNPCAPIGMEEHAFIVPEIFPNPATDRISVRLPQDLGDAGRLDAIDHAGRVVHTERILGSVTTMDTRAWSAGSYLLHVHVNGVRRGSARFVVMH